MASQRESNLTIAGSARAMASPGGSRCSHCEQNGLDCVDFRALEFGVLMRDLFAMVSWVALYDLPGSHIPFDSAELGYLEARAQAIVTVRVLLEMGELPAVANVLLGTPAPLGPDVSVASMNRPASDSEPDCGDAGCKRLSEFVPDGYDSDDSRFTWDSENGLPIDKRPD
ncbi:hypothetical protein PT974_03094 [Cladobotryum mycophilum]|uniref:Zn(2)-C6 fungal-type domain-containing protein n=1 Tax=Cladobotryum mycophilum TaxID=491253 RepID=A0ABR0SRF9_9HYPO